MAKKIYISTNGTLNRVKKLYVGVNDISRKVKRGYIGVDNVARLFYVSEYVWKRYNVIYTYYWDKYNSVTQHKWNKFSTIIKSEYKENIEGGSTRYAEISDLVTASDYTFDVNSGLYVLSSDRSSGTSGYCTGYHIKLDGNGTIDYSYCKDEPSDTIYHILILNNGSKVYTTIHEAVFVSSTNKGEFIEVATYINSRPYPDDGVYGDYWYTYIGDEQIKGDINYGQVNSNIISAYPDNGLSGNYWYVKNPKIDTAIGSYIDNVISDEPDTYPENGIKDGYWYVKQQI